MQRCRECTLSSCRGSAVRRSLAAIARRGTTRYAMGREAVRSWETRLFFFAQASFAHSAPAPHQVMGYVQLIEHACDDEVDEMLDLLRMMIETRVGGKDNGTRARKSQHILQMDRGERRFARNEDEL